MFDHKAHTYQVDLPLFEKLGIAPFNIELHTKHFLGEVTSESSGSYAKIWVRCTPEQIFEFEIFNGDAEIKYTANTGGGTLSDFWPIVEKMMGDMFVVQSVEKYSNLHEKRSD